LGFFFKLFLANSVRKGYKKGVRSIFSGTVLTRFIRSFPFCERSERQQKSKHPPAGQSPLHKRMGASWSSKNRAHIFVPISNAYCPMRLINLSPSRSSAKMVLFLIPRTMTRCRVRCPPNLARRGIIPPPIFSSEFHFYLTLSTPKRVPQMTGGPGVAPAASPTGPGRIRTG